MVSDWSLRDKSSSLQDSFQNSSRSQQCCCSHGLHSSSYFQVLQSLYQSFGNSTKNTNYNWYNRHFHVPQFFFNSLARSMYLSLFSLSFDFTLWSGRTAKFTILQVLFFLLIVIRSDRLVEIRGSVCISKSQRSLCVSISTTKHIPFFIWSNFDFLHNSQEIALPIQTCLILYSLYAKLLHSYCGWSFYLYHHITYICCFVLSYPFLLRYD